MVGTVWFDEDPHGPRVVVVWAAGTTEHLVEFLGGKPFDSHGERVEDYMRGGEVNAGGEGGGGNDGRE